MLPLCPKFRLDTLYRRPIKRARDSLAPNLRPPLKRTIPTLVIASLLALTNHLALAGSATWSLHPHMDIWNTPANWVPNTVPNGPNDIATFDHTQMASAEPTANTEVNSIVFTGTDPGFLVATGEGITLTISGGGVSNNTGLTRSFLTITQSAISLTNSATITGPAVVFQNNGTPIVGQPSGVTQFNDETSASAATFVNTESFVSGGTGGITQFNDNSTAATATITNQGDAHDDSSGGATQFSGTATAAFASITNEGGIGDGSLGGGSTEFFDNASAENATILNEAGGPIHDLVFPFGGRTFFHNNSTAANATLTTDTNEAGNIFGGKIEFFDASTADHATFSNEGYVIFLDNSTAANGAFTLVGGEVSFFDIATAANATFDIVDGGVDFNNNSSAGNMVVTREASIEFAGGVDFRDASTADHSTLIANGTSPSSSDSDSINFYDNSVGANATITLNPSTVTDAVGGYGLFADHSSAGDSIITINGAAVTGEDAAALLEFVFRATAGNATLSATGGTNGGPGGQIQFSEQAKGDHARVELLGNSSLDISRTKFSGVTIGSLEGFGQVSLGGKILSVGTNALDTVFSGTLQDDGIGGGLTKVGNGTLTLRGASTYSGLTTVSAVAS